jgi:hypothetical protein
MNTLRQTCAAVILSLAVAVSAFAGQIDSPGYVPPPPPPSGTSSTSITTTVILTIISLIR